MLRSILVALDGLPHSQAAIELSLRWAKQFDARLAGIGIVDQPVHQVTAAKPGEEGVPRMSGHWKDAAERVEQYVEQFRRQCREAQVTATSVPEVGVPWERIVLESHRHDLIVMSHAFAAPESLGDTFARVLQSCPRPVVAVPDNLAAADDIVLAYDGSLQSSRAMQLLVASGLHQAQRIYVVSIAADPEVAERLAKFAVDFLALHQVQAETRPLAGTDAPAGQLLQQVETLGAGLLVMGAHQKAPLKDLFVASVTKRLLKETTVPLFLYH